MEVRISDVVGYIILERDDIMATNSMLKNVDIKEKYLGRNLVEALEKAVQYSKKKSDTTITCEEISKERLKDIFG